MSGYIGNIPVPQATQTRDNFTASSGQTTFNTSGYTPQYLDVFLNGIHLDPADYTATDGNSVVLASGAAAGDVVSVVAWTAFSTVTGYNKIAEGIFENSNTIASDYEIASGNNGMSAGAIEIASGVTVTVPSGSTWTIV